MALKNSQNFWNYFSMNLISNFLLMNFFQLIFLNYFFPIVFSQLIHSLFYESIWNPCHCKDIELNSFSFRKSSGYLINYHFVMLFVAMICKVFCGGKFFAAFFAFKMYGFLMLMKHDLIWKDFVTVKAKGFYIVQIAALSTHYIYKQN